MTIKELRKRMRELDGKRSRETIVIDGWGQIRKIGNRYCIGPPPEDDDSDPMHDYSAWSVDWGEKEVLERIKQDLKIE